MRNTLPSIGHEVLTGGFHCNTPHPRPGRHAMLVASQSSGPPELTGGSVAVTQTLPAEALPWGFSSGRSIFVHLGQFKLRWFSVTQMVLIVTKYLHCEIYQSRNYMEQLTRYLHIKNIHEKITDSNVAIKEGSLCSPCLNLGSQNVLGSLFLCVFNTQFICLQWLPLFTHQ